MLKTLCGKIEITRNEYEFFIRESEKLDALIRYVEENSYMDRTDIAAIIGAELKVGEKNE